MNVVRAHIVFLGMIAWIIHAPPLRAADESQVKAQPFSLQLVPSDVTVWGIQSSQTFLVLGKYEDGLDRDVTFQTRLTLSSPQQGTIDERGRFVALDSGEVVLTATREGLTTTAKIHIRPGARRLQTLRERPLPARGLRVDGRGRHVSGPEPGVQRAESAAHRSERTGKQPLVIETDDGCGS